jgi:WD40 repeat protein
MTEKPLEERLREKLDELEKAEGKSREELEAEIARLKEINLRLVKGDVGVVEYLDMIVNGNPEAENYELKVKAWLRSTSKITDPLQSQYKDIFDFSPDSKHIALILGKGLYLVDIEFSKLIRSFGHGALFDALKFSSDGKFIASLKMHKQRPYYFIWDVDTGKKVDEGGSLTLFEAMKTGNVKSYWVSPGEAQNHIIRKARDHNILFKDYSPDGSSYICIRNYTNPSGYKASISLIDLLVKEDRNLVPLLVKQAYILSALISRNGRHILSCDEKGVIDMIDFSGNVLHTFIHPGATAITLSSDLKYVASAGPAKKNPAFRFWNIENGNEIQVALAGVCECSNIAGMYHISFSPDGKYFACDGPDRLSIWYADKIANPGKASMLISKPLFEYEGDLDTISHNLLEQHEIESRYPQQQARDLINLIISEVLDKYSQILKGQRSEKKK